MKWGRTITNPHVAPRLFIIVPISFHTILSEVIRIALYTLHDQNQVTRIHFSSHLAIYQKSRFSEKI